MIDHDRLFKELLSTFFVEFIELFFPNAIAYLEPDSVTLLDKEVFTDVTAGERYETDLLAQVRFRAENTFFLIHVETQASSDASFNKRMFRYFARLHEKFDLPIYPIVVFSYDQPKKAADSRYEVSFPDLQVLAFNYQVVQLNRLNWRDYSKQNNPVAIALMAKMNVKPDERVPAKLAGLRLLARLGLDPARVQLVSGFIDTYLRLNETEQERFEAQLNAIEPREREAVMEITTSWMEKGIEQGLEQGRQREAKALVIRLLAAKLGQLPSDLEAQVAALNTENLEELAVAVLNFSGIEDLRRWLQNR